MVNITRITQARTAAAAVSCLFIDFQGNLLTTFANLPYPAVSNIPVVALQSLDPSIPISAGQMWTVLPNNGSNASWSIQNSTTGMWLGYSQPSLETTTQAVLQATQENFGLGPVQNSGAFWILNDKNNTALTSWKRPAAFNYSAVTWETFNASLVNQAWLLRDGEPDSREVEVVNDTLSSQHNTKLHFTSFMKKRLPEIISKWRIF
ncbi:hypothetical protein B0H13DRAFT_1892148 [Mycena leptocephala]|nr:hypothetical protein B0H13DRAFT_1892148 [Mycena leptocephala]